MVTKKETIEFLKKANIEFEENTEGFFILSESRKGINDGYNGFFVDIVFDKDDNVIEFGIWE
jgi:hypothetical protein